jgi:uncharacterized membrane-anchored protein YhcB (DUF1043 family)
MYYRNYVHKSNVFGAGIIAFVVGALVGTVFGRKIKDKISQNPDFQDLKKEIYDKASKISDITQDKYNEIVDEVSNKYAQARGISRNELRDLVDDLKWHWKRIKFSWDNNRYTDDKTFDSFS